MLYRIQTLYLLISFFIYSISLNLLINQNNIKYYIIFKNISTIFIIICTILSIVSIFLFKYRKIQIIINKLNIILNIINFFLFLLFLDNISYNNFFFSAKMEFFFMLLSLSCNILLYIANIAITRDIEIVDSINRIR
ncbi:DUF4293 family protein [Blattabacterium cuenoti]|uniref:DUF4293 family protein n=1 Tax=Blattabacterium cuenoti TaxID=1653831 RepID=UPI00163BEA04|nr:DUF4293 family protein [Blattabacterium cuenoti]